MSFLLSEQIKKIIYGKTGFQKIANRLHRLSLRMMNFGTSEAAENGEKLILARVGTENSFPIIFDVGANTGQYAKLIDKVFQGRAKIFSFEPAKLSFSELLKNTVNIKNIQKYNFGFGSKTEKVILHYDREGSGLASVYKRKLDHLGGFWKESEQIQLRTVDDFCRENNIGKIDLLKMDVEGHELEILRGAVEMIDSNNILAIQFEFGGANIDSRTYFQDFYYLLKDKYRIYRILRDGLYEVKEYSELNEIFNNINYFACLK